MMWFDWSWWTICYFIFKFTFRIYSRIGRFKVRSPVFKWISRRLMICAGSTVYWKVLHGNDSIFPTELNYLKGVLNISGMVPSDWNSSIRHHLNSNPINVTYSPQCSNVLLLGITRRRLSREWIENHLYMLSLRTLLF